MINPIVIALVPAIDHQFARRFHPHINAAPRLLFPLQGRSIHAKGDAIIFPGDIVKCLRHIARERARGLRRRGGGLRNRPARKE